MNEIKKSGLNTQSIITGHLVLIAFALLSWWMIPLIFGNQGFGDSDRYLLMAQQPFTLTESPWGYRFVIPWFAAFLSNISGYPLPEVFQFLQFVSYLLCLVLIKHVAEYFELSIPGKALCLLLFTFGYQFVYYRHNYIHIGMFEFLFLGVLVWKSYMNQWTSVVLVLSFSILVKESIAFVFLQAIVIFWLLETYVFKNHTMKLNQLISICVFPIVVFISVRFFMSFEVQEDTEGYLNAYNSVLFAKIFNGNFLGRVIDYMTVFGVLTFVVLKSCFRVFSSRFVRLNLLIFAFSGTQLLLAVDSKRMACVAIISVIFLFVTESKEKCEQFPMLLLAVLQIVYAFGWFSQTYWIALGAMACAAVVFFSAALRRVHQV